MSSLKYPEVIVLTTSFPRFVGDEASLFLGRLIDALSEIGISGQLIVPLDSDESRHDLRGKFRILRYRYGLTQKGELAFGQGILPNLRAKKSRALQIPGFLLQMFVSAYRKCSQAEIIHGHWIATAIPAYILHRCTGKPFIITVRGEDIKLLKTPLKSILCYLLKRAAAITSVSDSFVAELKSLVPELSEKLTCIPNGITQFSPTLGQQEDLRQQLSLPKAASILLYVGRVIEIKRPKQLIDLLAALQQDNSILILAGRIATDYQEQLFSYATQKGVLAQLRIPGALTPSEIGTLYSLATLYLSASSHEGRSNAVLEALAAGLPVCASDIDGHREVVSHGENGAILSFQAESLETDLMHVRRLLSDSEKRLELSQNSKESVAHLSWRACAERFQALYTDVLERS